MMKYVTVIIVLIFVILLQINKIVSQSENSAYKWRPEQKGVLDYFQPIDYDKNQLANQHKAIKNRKFNTATQKYSTNQITDKITFMFSAYNLKFTLQLQQDSSHLHSTVEFNIIGEAGTKRPADYDPGTHYRGVVLENRGSVVYGHIIPELGIFDGIIHAYNQTFHIEPANRFLLAASFHTILYRMRDVSKDVRNSINRSKNNNFMQLMENLNSEIIQLNTDGDDDNDDDNSGTSHERLPRSPTSYPTNLICGVYIAADHTFYESVGGSDDTQTINELITHLNSANSVYLSTDFDNDGTGDNVGFALARVEIFKSSQNPANPFQGTRTFTVATDYLNAWSNINHNSFCLALLFGYRELNGGVLGLAWVASSSQSFVGGICQQRVSISGIPKSLNTGIVTFRNFNRRQPRAVTTITVAHEWGHNYGSPHDSETDPNCSPGTFGDSRGNYIMFPSATDGTQSNNNKFSECSRNSILPVLLAKSDCFLSTTAVCGNLIVEQGEICDCGSTSECNDPCCDANNCMLAGTAECSPQASAIGGVCCTSSCTFVPSGNMQVCRTATVCSNESICDGQSASCPASFLIQDGTTCSRSGTCLNGDCIGSICNSLASNLTECQCTDRNQLCDVCCTVSSGQCLSTFDIPGIDGVLKDAGRSCDNFQGYCSSDTQPKCELVDNDSVLRNLYDLFSIENVLQFKDWLATYWYIPVIIVIVIIVLVILLHVTYRRKKEKIDKFTKNTINRARNTLRRGSTPREVGRIDSRQIKMPAMQAVSRIKAFFPTVDTEIIKGVIVNAGTEHEAIKSLLDAGFPLLKI